MSKDIWHKPTETTDVDNNLIIDDWTNSTYELGYFDDNDMIFRNLRNDDIYFEESMMRWCNVNDLIDDYNCTRKALEIAITGLKNCKTRDHIGAVCRIPEYVDKILEQIKTTLEQKDVK